MKENIINTQDISKDDQKKWFQHLKDLLTRDVAALLRCSPEEGLQWIDTQVDLVEVAHIVWETGNIIDNTGRRLSFQQIADRLCLVLHTPKPHNVYAVYRDAVKRKGVWVEPLTVRYINLIRAHVVRDPFVINIHLPKLQLHKRPHKGPHRGFSLGVTDPLVLGSQTLNAQQD